MRRLARSQGGATDRRSLQELGDALVRQDAVGFVAGAFGMVPIGWSTIVAEGVRHRSVIEALRDHATAAYAEFAHVHLVAPPELRRSRLIARGETSSDALLADDHPAEQESLAWLLCNADLCLDTDRSIDLLVAAIGARWG